MLADSAGRHLSCAVLRAMVPSSNRAVVNSGKAFSLSLAPSKKNRAGMEPADMTRVAAA